MREAAEWLKNRLERAGLEVRGKKISTLFPSFSELERRPCMLMNDNTQRVEILETEGPHPVVYGEWLKGGPGKPTVLIYGHYDVQVGGGRDQSTVF